MRFFTTIFVIIFLFSSSYANAWVAVAAKTAKVVVGSVLVTKTIDFAKTGGQSAVNYCKSNKKKCKEYFGDLAELVFDSFGDDDGGGCIIKFGNYPDEMADPETIYSNALRHYKVLYNGAKSHEDWYDGFSDAYEIARDKCDDFKGDFSWTWVYSWRMPIIINSDKAYASTNWSSEVSAYIRRGNFDDEYYKKKDKDYEDLYDLIKDKLDKDKEKEIYNHPSNEQIIKKYCQGFGSCIEFEPEFNAEYQKNEDDYDLEKMDEKNCEMRKGKIKSCDNAKKKKDDDGGSDKDIPKKDDDKEKDDDSNGKDDENEKKDDDNKDESCSSSKFHKKVCDWIDWTQKKDDKDDSDTKVKVENQDIEKLDKNLIKFNSSCPAPYIKTVKYAGVTKNIKISYQGYCDFFIKLKPLLIGTTGIICIMIISGRRI